MDGFRERRVTCGVGAGVSGAAQRYDSEPLTVTSWQVLSGQQSLSTSQLQQYEQV
jgi:hypothetical protein